MSVTVEKVRLPIEFEFSKETDSRFRKVKVWIAHTGENLNGSYFEKEVLEDMAKTLSGTPIVGFIERVEGTEKDDFSDHRNEITVKEDGIHVRYAGHAYGFIPEENNHKIEIRDGKEWLTAEGYLWTKFSDAMDTFTAVNGIKSQSMEIDNVEGHVDDLGRIEIVSARFSALCILGDTVQPAMDGSTVEFFSNKENQYQDELNEMIYAFELEKGESRLEDNITKETENTEEIVIKEPELDTQATVVEDGAFTSEPEAEAEQEEEIVENEFVNNEQEPEAEAEQEGEAEFKEDNDEDEDEDEDEKDENEDDEKSFKLEFELSHDDVRTKLYKSLRNAREEDDYSDYYIIQVYDAYFLCQVETYTNNGYESKYIKVIYDKQDDGVVLGEHQEIFPMFVSTEEKDAIEGQRAKVAELTQELESLQSFKAEIDNQQKEMLVSEFEEQIGKEKAEDIRSNFSQFSVEDVEKEVALNCFEFMRNQPKDEAISVPTAQFKANKSSSGANKYGSLTRLFN